MIKSLVINCSLDVHAKNVKVLSVLNEFTECRRVAFRDISVGYGVAEDIDAVVLTGSTARIVNPSHRALFDGTLDLIKHLNRPLFSICFGYQLLCWAFGARVASLVEPIQNRFEQVHIVDPDEIFANCIEHQLISVAESHYDYVLNESLSDAGLVLLADSRSCEVEAVKHKDHPFYGVQFHPERIDINGEAHREGHKILGNFFQNVVNR